MVRLSALSRVVYVQFGSFAEAVRRFAGGGPETFYAQRYSVDFVTKLAQSGHEVTVLTVQADEPHEKVEGGVDTLGVQLFPPGKRPRWGRLLWELTRLRPTHVILTTPLSVVLAWALARSVRVLPLFADSFRAGGLKARVSAKILAQLLGSQRIPFVTNHNLAASLDLVRLGVAPEKVLPWDWPELFTPGERPAKEKLGPPPWRVVYVGQVTEPKGVGDLIEAMGLLRAELGAAAGERWHLDIAGGHDPALKEKVERLGLSEMTTFLGRIPHAEVIPLRGRSDVVVVPSRPAYPEGLPFSLYEAFCSRTPLVASTHPMFRLKVRHEVNALVFQAGEPAALASALRRLTSDPALYGRLSAASEEAGKAFFCPLKVGELVTRWLRGETEDHRVLASYSLATGRYGSLETDLAA